MIARIMKTSTETTSVNSTTAWPRSPRTNSAFPAAIGAVLNALTRDLTNIYSTWFQANRRTGNPVRLQAAVSLSFVLRSARSGQVVDEIRDVGRQAGLENSDQSDDHHHDSTDENGVLRQPLAFLTTPKILEKVQQADMGEGKQVRH